MKIRTKLLLTAVAVIALLGTQTVLIIRFIGDLQVAAVRITDTVELAKVADRTRSLTTSVGDLAGTLVDTEPGTDERADGARIVDGYLDDLVTMSETVATGLAELASGRDLAPDLTQAVKAVRTEGTRYVAALGSDDPDLALEHEIYLSDAGAGMLEVLARIDQSLGEELDAAVAAERAVHDRPVQASIAASVAIGAVVVSVMIVLHRAITGPIRRLTARMRDVSDGEGDLVSRVHPEGGAELAQLAGAFNDFAEKMRTTILGIREMTGEVELGTNQIASANEQMLASMGQQADHIKGIMTSMDTLSGSTHRVADRAESVAKQASDSAACAQAGGQAIEKNLTDMQQVQRVVESTSTTIAELGRHGSEIATMVSAIEEITERTNLLALNAAIEAARAGEHGRGFAVVADEVRKLASQTDDTTARITSLIKEIQAATSSAITQITDGRAQVEQSVSQASDAGEQLEKILSSVREVTQQAMDIAGMVEEQQQSDREVGSSLERINASTEEARLAIQHGSEAAFRLNDQAARLAESLSRFKLDPEAAASAPAPVGTRTRTDRDAA